MSETVYFVPMDFTIDPADEDKLGDIRIVRCSNPALMAKPYVKLPPLIAGDLIAQCALEAVSKNHMAYSEFGQLLSDRIASNKRPKGLSDD